MICIDLFCGLGGWAEGFLAEGYDVIGFDIEKQPEYPGEFVWGDVKVLLRDVREKHCSGWYGKIAAAAVIVASPPCEEFSRWDQPWTRKRNPPKPSTELVEASFEIACITGVPIVLENVRGAQKFIGPARWHFGKQYLWGDVPALMPKVLLQNHGRQKQTLSSTRKAERAKIPFDLANHIARVYKP